MNVLITGASGFVGKNLVVTLNKLGTVNILTVTKGSEDLTEKVESADFIFHLAGVNRPNNDAEYVVGNADLTLEICNLVKKQNRRIPIVFTSSIQATNNSAYGKSKKQAEEHLLAFSNETGNPVHIYRLPNLFGKWCRPNYNSVVATFCHNIANDLPINVNDPSTELSLVHVGAVITSFLEKLNQQKNCDVFTEVAPIYKVTLGEVADLLQKYKNSRKTIVTEPVGDGFERLLYATYISYLAPDSFSYDVVKHEDPRGVFVEMLKTKNSGQFSYFTAHPGVTRGGHYHHVKTEKFLVIRGKAKFGFRHIVTDEYYELITYGGEPKIVETVPGWSHDITNIGEEELIVMLWANENFNPLAPDTVNYKV